MLQRGGLTKPAHELDKCLLYSSDDGRGEELPRLSSIEESDDGCTRLVRPDMRTAKSVVPSAAESDSQIKSSEDVLMGTIHLRGSDGAQQVKGGPGVRSVAGSIAGVEQRTAKCQGGWLNCDEEFTLVEDLPGVCTVPLR